MPKHTPDSDSDIKPHLSKPYTKPTSNSKPKTSPKPQSKADTNPKPNPTTTSGTPKNNSRAWTADEMLQLYTHVVTRGRTEWEAAVPGRTANQARQKWCVWCGCMSVGVW